MAVDPPQDPGQVGFEAAMQRAAAYGREVPLEALNASLEEARSVYEEYEPRIGNALLSFLAESVTLAAMARIVAEEPPLDRATVTAFFEQATDFFNNFSDW